MPSSDDLIAQYRTFALMQDKYQLEDSRKANYAFNRRLKVEQALLEAGPERYREILTLLDDENLHVRQVAAYDALSIEPELGLRVLREIAAGPRSVHRLNARLTLEMWEAGTLPMQLEKTDE